MNRGLCGLVLVIVAGRAAGQEFGPPPARELEALLPFAGSWEGQGTMRMGPGPSAATSTWTASMEARWVLGGHYLRTETVVQFADMPGAMRFLEFAGWDGEMRRHVNLAVGNTGEGSLAPIHFDGPGSYVSLQLWMRNGQPMAERARMRVQGDTLGLSMTMLGALGDSSKAVEGTLKRVASVKIPSIEEAGPFVPAPAEMERLGAMAGTYVLQGEWTAAPGAPPVKIQGREVVRPLFGGSVLLSETKGTAEGMPGTYEAFAFRVWNARAGCYEQLHLSNMAEIGSGEFRLLGEDAAVVTRSGLRQGQPFVARSILELEKGRPVRVETTTALGTSAALVDFRGSYARVP